MHNLLFCGARLIDGSGAPARDADVAVNAGLISGVFDADSAERRPAARQVIECGGQVLAPGFIDAHTHDDALMLEAAPLHQPHPKLSQGVTTVVVGNCGISIAPLHISVPPTAARDLPDLSQHATDAQAAAMAAEVDAAPQQGAWGLSTGVVYPPAQAATTAELIAVARPVGPAGAVITMHIRDDTAHIVAAVQEAFEVGRAAGAPVVISHHKLSGMANHGRSTETLAQIDAASLGQEVCLDCYPYTASSTMLIPERVGLSREVLITWSQAEPAAAGRSLFRMAKKRGLEPQVLARQLVPVGVVNFSMDEADVQRIMKHPLRMIGSDGLPHDPHPHPRLWGSFPRVLGHYAHRQGLFTLETAIRKMTAWPAERSGLDRAPPQRAARGQIQPGWAADLVLFDAEQVIDHASYDAPMQPSSGITAVYLGGELAAHHGMTANAHAGRVLRRVGWSPHHVSRHPFFIRSLTVHPLQP